MITFIKANDLHTVTVRENGFIIGTIDLDSDDVHRWLPAPNRGPFDAVTLREIRTELLRLNERLIPTTCRVATTDHISVKAPESAGSPLPQGTGPVPVHDVPPEEKPSSSPEQPDLPGTND